MRTHRLYRYYYESTTKNPERQDYNFEFDCITGIHSISKYKILQLIYFNINKLTGKEYVDMFDFECCQIVYDGISFRFPNNMRYRSLEVLTTRTFKILNLSHSSTSTKDFVEHASCIVEKYKNENLDPHSQKLYNFFLEINKIGEECRIPNVYGCHYDDNIDKVYKVPFPLNLFPISDDRNKYYRVATLHLRLFKYLQKGIKFNI